MPDFQLNDATPVSAPTMVSTWGGVDSVAYWDVNSVHVFLTSSVVDHEAWTNATVSQRVAAIIAATRDVDSIQFVGQRLDISQALECPRRLFRMSFEYRAAYMDRLQKDVREATAYQALHILRSGGRNEHLEHQAQGIKSYSESVGPIRESYTYASAGVSRLCTESLARLSDWRESKRVLRG